ncbi:hypothetical protein GpartN1_g3238.t1 [Galdieria partita]|uniref:biotin synthase n=1 Tax=Galdieria partita TaxID=83374 RepID=A0A9C7PX23_9RHOD|nr:hypothetical protein GpartN1_g3238.t1 [Galdieria partita]
MLEVARQVMRSRQFTRFSSVLARPNGTHSSESFPVRSDWTLEQVENVYRQPLLELIYQAATVHRQYFDSTQVQQCTLLSIKSGGCPEDCKYCSQSSHHKTFVKAEPLMQKQEILQAAKQAKESGSTRFCMGAAWRGVSQVGNRQFERVLDVIREIRSMGLEVCATLGLLTKDQAVKLKEAGLTAYNHNLDTSREFYPKVISTRTFEDRLNTLQSVRDAGISVCCGGILGLGETDEDRISLLHTLATMPKHPESVPVNALVATKGTPLEDMKPVSVWEMCRMIASARILMPSSMVRLSAGRISLSPAEQALCFLSGANSIFTGERLLTTPNNEFTQDQILFQTLGLTGKPPFFPMEKEATENSKKIENNWQSNASVTA